MVIAAAQAAGAAEAPAAAHGPDFLLLALIFLAAAVVAVPLANRARLGSIVGYLVAGVVIGPQVTGLVTNGATVLAVAELGIVMFLFLIGLEMKPSRIWGMRRDIFGLGALQVGLTICAVIWVPLAFGRSPEASLVAAMGLAITSTGILMQVLAERGEVQAPHGQRAFAVSIFQDLMVVPMLAIVALLAPVAAQAAEPWWVGLAKVLGAVAAVVVAGRYALNPLFRLVATSGSREIMTAAALLVVIGAAAIMTAAGLSMAMGAFLAGVFLAESKFRHQLEADIEPFRGLLMGLFFIAIGMTVDLKVIAEAWWRLAIALAFLIVLKAAVMYAVMRLFRYDHAQSVRVALLIAQAGEFGFVLYAAAVANGVMRPDHGSVLVALVVLSMAVAPFLYRLVPLLAPERSDAPAPDEDFSDAKGSVLVIGFGRFGQVTTQMLLAEAVDVTIIDNDVEMIEAAQRFAGRKVYYGDGARYDVLRAAGADRARLILVCIDRQDDATRIVETCKVAFPLARVYARSYDRRHTLTLIEKGVDYELREVFESAIRFGREALVGLDLPEERAAEVEQDIRRRDAERLVAQQAGDMLAGRDKLYGAEPVQPAPLVPPRRPDGARAAARAAPSARTEDPAAVDGGAGL
jgi:glutathione-regulated potassium-efflux system protein KefB